MTHATQAPQVQASSSGRVLSILGFVFGAVALLIFPPLFGAAGIVCAGVAWSKGDRLAKPAMVVAVLGLVLGMVIGAVVMSANS